MSYFDDASLVMIPSGYKDQKVYSVKPIDGSGDLTFTRSNDTATRVGPDGLIQKVRTNLALQSQTFDNASWTKYQSSVTANSTTAPDGTLTADTLADTAVNDTHQIQLETGVATDYIATTSAAVSVGPVANLPRLDYSGGATCPKLLLEPQRTNVITNNNDFATGASNVTVLSNNATSPEGYQNADLITGDAGTLTKVVNFNGASAGQYTVSVFAKYNTQQWIQLGAGGIASFANFDIQNGVVGTTNVTSSIEDYGNGWYRCSINMVSGTPLSHYVGIITNGTSARLSTTASTGSFWAYGIQSEIGAYPTSVIPTLGAAVTRGADDYSTLSGLNMFLSIRPTASTKVEVYRDEGTIYADLTASSSFALSASEAVGTHKIAFAYKSGSSALYIDGVLAGQSTTSFTFSDTLSNLFINQRSGGTFIEAANYKQVLLFTTRLSNSSLAALTA
jgi:hypothetical protein